MVISKMPTATRQRADSTRFSIPTSEEVFEPTHARPRYPDYTFKLFTLQNGLSLGSCVAADPTGASACRQILPPLSHQERFRHPSTIAGHYGPVEHHQKENLQVISKHHIPQG